MKYTRTEDLSFIPCVIYLQKQAAEKGAKTRDTGKDRKSSDPEGELIPLEQTHTGDKYNCDRHRVEI